MHQDIRRRGFGIAVAAVLGVLACGHEADAQTASGSGTGIEQSNIQIIGDALLKGFQFRWRGYDDHHIRQLSVEPNPYQSNVKVGYFDKNFDDVYNWKVSLNSFNGSRHDGRETGSCRGRCSRSLSIPRGYVFVLTGFKFAFRGTDHHIDEVGVWERNGQLTVAFNDKNNDDIFDWSVDYLLVPRSTFRTIQSSNGSSRGRATTTSVARTR